MNTLLKHSDTFLEAWTDGQINIQNNLRVWKSKISDSST